MKLNRVITPLSLLIASVALITGCSQTIILFKPSPYIDPMPEDPSKDEKSEADPMVKEQWALKKVGMDEKAISSGDFKGNYNVKVAILSTGIDYNHEDIRGQVAVNRAEISDERVGDGPKVNRKDDDENGLIDDVVGYDVVDGDGFAFDRHGAGTAVAGIIAARRNNGKGISGLVENISLYPIRYINDNGQTSMAGLLAALEIVDKVKPDVVYIQTTEIKLGGAKRNPEVAMVEMSMLKQSLDKIKKAKIPVIVGAGDNLGNFGNEKIHKTIMSYDNIVVVTASDKNDELPLLANSSFENVMTSAPGEEVISTKPFNNYGVVHGTAYAAAHVTAAYALAKSMFGDKLTYEKINPVLVSAKGSDVVPGMTRFSRGGNRLNVKKFLAELRSR